MLYVNYIPTTKSNFLKALFLNKVTLTNTGIRNWIYLFVDTIQYRIPTFSVPVGFIVMLYLNFRALLSPLIEILKS